MLPGAVGREPPSAQKGEITANSPQEYLSASYRALPISCYPYPNLRGRGRISPISETRKPDSNGVDHISSMSVAEETVASKIREGVIIGVPSMFRNSKAASTRGLLKGQT